jgi:transposase
MRFVELKTQEQLDIQTLHRVRSRLVAERRSLINQLRAILLERGTVFPVGRRKLALGIDEILATGDTTLSPRLCQLVDELRGEWRELDARIEGLNGEFVELARNDPAARRLTSIPGVGVLNATALIAAVGNASSFAKARPRCLAWSGPSAAYYRREAPAAWHLKTRQHLLAHLIPTPVMPDSRGRFPRAR